MGHRHFSKTLKISTGKNRALMTRKDDAATNMATMAARQCTASILCEWATKIISKIAVPMPGFKLCICRGPQMTSEWGTCTCYFGKCLQDMYGSVWKYGLPKKLPYFTKMDDDDSEFSLNVQSKQKKHAMIDPALPTITSITSIAIASYSSPTGPWREALQSFSRPAKWLQYHMEVDVKDAPKLWSFSAFFCLLIIKYYYIMLYPSIDKKTQIHI